MSLNGLDAPAVKEAHEAVVAEAGGWFLLKYSSRDEVELLSKGSGGIVEIRNSIAQYEETSPLYGLLRYRRRNVIIKYLPEDCSRLVQARVTVHLNSVCERFAPYDTVFDIANAKELKDTKLSAACSLHAASGSTSSSTSSLRRRRLMEIAEEEEEEQRAKRQSVVKEEEVQRPDAGEEPSSTALHPALSAAGVPTVTLNAELAASPEQSQFSGGNEPPTFSGLPRPGSPAKSVDAARGRNSFQSARPDLYSLSSFSYSKNKVKLGPRPSLEVSSRPQTAGGYRPISTIPAGFKLFSKNSKRDKGKGQEKSADPSDPSAGQDIPEVGFLTANIPIPEDRAISDHPPRPTTSSGVSTKSAMTTGTQGAGKMTPEKARLMKAMQLREKKKKLGNMPIPSIETPVPSSLTSPGLSEGPETILEEDAEQNEDLLRSEDPDALKRRSMSNADSAISIEGTNDQASVDTRTDSHPPSPNVASSELGDSTKASSLSESTDETIQAGTEEKVEFGAEQHIEQEDEVGAQSPILNPESSAPSNPKTTDVDDLEEEKDVEASTADDSIEEGTLKTDKEELVAAEPEANVIETISEIPQQAQTAHSEIKAADEQPWERETPEASLLGDDNDGETSEIAAEESPEAVTVPEPTARRPALPISKFSSTPATETRNDTEDRKLGSPQYKIPKSKFAKSPDLNSSAAWNQATVPSIVTPPANEGHARPDLAVEEVVPTEEPEQSPGDDRQARRKAVIEPIRTDLQLPEQDVSNLSDDDSLLDELQSATVQEARPVKVSKSPVAPVFPSTGTPTQTAGSEFPSPRVVRTVSNPIRGPLLVPGDVSQSSARTVSSGAAFLHKLTQQQSSPALTPAKPGKIGSSISQRIKALEKLSSSAGGGAAAPSTPGGSDPSPRPERPSSSFFSVRKASVREPSKSPLVAERANSLTQRQTPSPPQSRESSSETIRSPPRRDRSGSMASRLSIFENGGANGRTESIQVTARIVRDPSQPFPKLPDTRSDGKDLPPLNLKQSPLVVDLQKSSPAPAASAPSATAMAGAAAAAAPSPVIALGPGPEESQLDADKPKESLLQRRFSRGNRRSQSQDRTSILSLDESKFDEETVNRPRRRSSLSVVRDYIKERRNSLRVRSPSTETLHLNPPATAGGVPQTPSRSPSRPPSVHQNLGYPQRLSISSRRSSVSRDTLMTGTLSPSLMSEASPAVEEGRAADASADKRSKSRAGSIGVSSPEQSKNRASRFIRRLSSSLGGGRKNAVPTISPTVAEEDAAEVEASSTISRSLGGSQQPPSVVAFLGDVNVQFPDNLLWKRRTLCLDSLGFLLLSPVQGAAAAAAAGGVAPPTGRDKSGGAVKRYHLGDFCAPYTPEVEVQELPNSVVLDFIDGGGLQIACGDRVGQLHVLHVLQDAHRGHSMLGR